MSTLSAPGDSLIDGASFTRCSLAHDDDAAAQRWWCILTSTVLAWYINTLGPHPRTPSLGAPTPSVLTLAHLRFAHQHPRPAPSHTFAWCTNSLGSHPRTPSLGAPTPSVLTLAHLRLVHQLPRFSPSHTFAWCTNSLGSHPRTPSLCAPSRVVITIAHHPTQSPAAAPTNAPPRPPHCGAAKRNEPTTVAFHSTTTTNTHNK